MNILFVVKGLNTGGVEKSLISFANELAKTNKVSVKILNNCENNLINELNENIEVIYSTKRLNKYMKFYFNERTLKFSFIKRLFYKLLKTMKLENMLYAYYTKKDKDNKTYDVAISYTGYLGIWDYYMKKSVFATKKLVWIHNNPYALKLDLVNLAKKYKHYNKIYNVSEYGFKALNIIHPSLKDKNNIMHNLIDEDRIKLESLEPLKFNTNLFNIITVARLENNQKRIDRIIEVATKLKANNFKFNWHILGDGVDRHKIEASIKSNQLNDLVILYGNVNNPYKYIKNANLFVLTSDYEGLPLVFNECMFLKKPVLTTNFESAYEIIKEGENGFIVEKDVLSIYHKLSELINEYNNNITRNYFFSYQTNNEKIKSFLNTINN